MMLCSTSASKSSSSWLDRLRISKGFPLPSDLDLDLDHFLSSQPNPSPNPNPNPNPNSDKKTKKKNDKVVDPVASALADLFVMGGPREQTKPPAKTLRKQPVPRAFVPSAPASADDSCRVAPSPPSADNSVSELRKARKAKPPRRKRRSKGPASADLGAYSRTEVTVIDTSSPGWKSEKIIFRRGPVWKVRDKKVWCAWRKKRKLGLVEKLVGEKGDKLRVGEAPVWKEQLALVDEVLIIMGIETMGFCLKLESKDYQSPQRSTECTRDDNRDASKETLDQIQLPRRRPKFSRSPHVPAAEDSSVHGQPVITPSSKYGTSRSRSKLKVK